jgi:flagellar motor switch protein FliN
VQGFFDFVKSLGAARMAAMAAVTLALVGFFSFVMIQMTTPQMVPLFTDLSVEDSASIIKDLERQAITYQLKNDGTIIMVPKDKVARLRMKLAESGLPKGGGVGYEIFDKSDALGATTFVQNINHLRALEGELARTIRSIERVQAARVHLVLPERRLFSREKVEASASIVLKVRGALEPQQVRAVRHLVATAVNGLRPERVSVIDETGKLLADEAAPDNSLSGVSSDERKLAYENRLRSEVEAIVSSVVGPGLAPSDPESVNRGAADLEAVFDVPVQVSAVLGRAHMDVGSLLKLGPGAMLKLDRKVGEAIDIYVNNRLVARGEVVLVEDKTDARDCLPFLWNHTELSHATLDHRRARGPAHHRDQARDGQGRERHSRRQQRSGARCIALRSGRRSADGGRGPRHS